ncbi:MAG: hypothetical protein V4509_01785 [Patescibacteria group bacterium]
MTEDEYYGKQVTLTGDVQWTGDPSEDPKTRHLTVEDIISLSGFGLLKEEQIELGDE